MTCTRRRSYALRPWIATLLLLWLGACSDSPRLTNPRTASDTTGLAARLLKQRANGPRFDVDANGQFVNANIPVTEGSYLTFELESTDNGWCDNVYLGGVLSGTLFTGVGPSWCNKPGPVTIGPVKTGGIYTIVTETSLFFASVGKRGTARVESMYNGGSYRVFLEDSGDGDFNDIVLRVWVTVPELALDCNQVSGQNINVEVTRGDSVKCEVRSLIQSRGPAWSSGWTFNGKPRSGGDKDSNVWAGVMVQSGVIEVKAHVAQERNPSAPEQTLRATVAVKDRSWSGKSPAYLTETVRNGTDSDPETALPLEVLYNHHLGHTAYRATKDHLVDFPPDPTDEVRGGPNDGLYYYKDLTFPAYIPVILNDQAMTRGSAFYSAQVQDNFGGSGSSLGKIYCPQSYVLNGLRAAILRHELKHVEVFQNVRAGAVVDSIRAWEAKVDSLGDSDMVDAYRREWKRVNSLAIAESGRVVDDTRGPYATRYEWHGRPCELKNVNGGDLINQGGR